MISYPIYIFKIDIVIQITNAKISVNYSNVPVISVALVVSIFLLSNLIPKHSLHEKEIQNNLSGVNLNMKHDKTSSFNSSNGNDGSKKSFKGTCFVCEKLRRQIIFNECLNKSDIKK